MAETLASHGRQRSVLLVQPWGFLPWGGNGVGGCGWCVVWAPCWVLRERPRVGVGLSERSTWRTSPVTGQHSWSWPRWWGCGCGCGPCVGVVGCVFVETCTVDASIFVVKLLRAHGECVGTRSRLRTWVAAIGLGELST